MQEFPHISIDIQETCATIKEYINSGQATKKKYLNGKYIWVDAEGRILVPEAESVKLIQYFHIFFAHPGISKLTETLKQSYKIKNIKVLCTEITERCLNCATNKNTT